METKVLRSAMETHPIIFRVLSHDSTLVSSIVGGNGLRSNTHFVVVMAEIEHVSNEEFMEEVARYEYVYLGNSKDFKVMTRTKRPTFGEKNRAEV